MKTEVKQQTTSANYRLIMYPDGLPSTGYVMTKQQLYALYVELRDLFSQTSDQEVEPTAEDE